MKIKGNKHRVLESVAIVLVVLLFTSCFFNNVAAAHTFYTIEDNNANITLNSEDSFTISLEVSGMYEWDYSSSNSSILKFIEFGGYATNPGVPGRGGFYNWTFEGAEKGTTTLKFFYWVPWEGNESIIDTFFLNVTSNVNKTVNNLLIIIIFTIIIVVPSALILKWMRGERKNEN